MKITLALSILSIFAMGHAFAQTSTEAILDLSGSVSEQLAIDIDSPSGANSGCINPSHECNSDVGELTSLILDDQVAQIGVMSNNGYNIEMYSDNGGLLGQQAGVNSNQLDQYKLGWDDVNLAQFPPQSADASGSVKMLPTSVAPGTYECSLLSGCPGTATARHSIHFTQAANPSLPYGTYADKVHFVIVDGTN
jgi:hypothetical protein